jgi:hypothetical protein
MREEDTQLSDTNKKATFNIVPRWRDILHVMLDALRNPDTPAELLKDTIKQLEKMGGPGRFVPRVRPTE